MGCCFAKPIQPQSIPVLVVVAPLPSAPPAYTSPLPSAPPAYTSPLPSAPSNVYAHYAPLRYMRD